MVSGILGKADLAAATPTAVYTVAVGLTATVSVNFCNRNAVPVLVRLSTYGTTLSGYLIYDFEVGPNESLERTGLVLQAGLSVTAQSNLSGVSAIVYGFEE